MHPNQLFRKADKSKNIQYAQEQSFGVLCVNTGGAPLISHVPFQLSNDGSYLEAHLVRSNPIVRLAKETVEAVMAVSGVDAYVSPDWYGIDDQVPTWNYIAVHLSGDLKLLDQGELHGILTRLSENMENRLLPKNPWKIDKMNPDIFNKMTRQIVPVAMEITDIQGTWKLSQNKPVEAREGVMKALGEIETPSPEAEMIAQMKTNRE